MAVTAKESDITRGYHRDGFITMPSVLPKAAVQELLAGVSAAAERRPEATVHNQGDNSLRIVYAVHEQGAPYSDLVRHPAILPIAQELLGGDVYVHQTKVNLNTPGTGEGWPWHRDYSFWRTRDRLPREDCLSAAVLLDDMTPVNGPLMLVPRSHQEDLPETETGVLSADDIAKVCRARGIHQINAPAGSVVFFHSQVLHGSSPNITPFDRRVLYITYNRADNTPDLNEASPPDYTCSRDFEPVQVAAAK